MLMATYCTRIYVKVTKQELMEKLSALDVSDIGKGYYSARDIFASSTMECTFYDGESAINEGDLQVLVARVVEVIRGQGTILAETWSYDYDPFPQVCYYLGDEIVSKLLDMDGSALKEAVNINDVSAWVNFVENADEYDADEAGMDDENSDESDSFATLPRFICDTDTVNQLASSEPNIGQCDPNLAFVMEYTDAPLTLLYVPAIDEVKKIASQVKGVVIDEDASAYILFFRRGTFPISSFAVGMQAYAGIIMKTGEIKGGATNKMVNRYFGPLVGAMLRLNIWLQNGDTYAQYNNLDRETSAILVTAEGGEITARIVKGKERPNMQCEDLFNLQSLFADDPEVVSARPYLDEISAGWDREMMSIEEKIEQAEAGDTDCMDELAMQYLNGDDEVDAEPEKALYWFRKLAEAGHPNGMFNLGLFYAKGFCVPRDFKQAAEWMRKAEQAGDEDATALVELYTSMMENEKKAKQGDAEAQAALANGLMKLGGSLEQAGSGNDYKECVSWAQKSAAQGNTDAMWVLALAYHHGRGVKQDMDQAIAYYKKGADLGNADCMHNLGCEYLSGEHLWKNEKKGFDLVKRAAEKGNGLAMYNLGRAYQFGTGCAGNMQKALEWYEKAAEVLHDPQIEQRVMAFRSLSEIQPDFDEDYSGGEEDPWDDVPLERTQYEGRADRCERLRPGTILEYRFSKDQNNQPVLEMFYQSGSVGVISHFKSEKIIEFLKKDRITLKVIVKSCIPKSQRGARARSADVTLTLEIDDKLPGVPVGTTERSNEANGQTKKHDADCKREETRACKKPEKNEKRTKDMANATVADRIHFGPFFSVAPVAGLMVADHKKEEYEEGDIVAEIFNTSFGREPELGLFGGFSNGINIKVSKLLELSAEQLESMAESIKNDEKYESVTERPDIFVGKFSVEVQHERGEGYVIVTRKGVLSAVVDLGIVSRAEADSYRKMFATAQSIPTNKAHMNAPQKLLIDDEKKMSASIITEDKIVAYPKENNLPYDQENLDNLTPYDVLQITEGTCGKENGTGKPKREGTQKAEADRKREEAKKAEENRKRKEELARQETQKREAERKQKKAAEEAERKQKEACKAKEDAVSAKRNAEVKRCDEDIKKWTEQKTSAEQKLASLGFLRFGEKKRQREIIEASMANIEKSKSEKANLITKYDQELTLIRAAAKHGVNVSDENDLLKFAICDALKDGRSHLMSEITQACPVLAELSSGRMIALMRQLTLEGKVTRIERSMKTYFQLEKDPVYTPASPACSTASAPPTPTQIENESYKRMILDLLSDGRRYTVTDIQKANSKLGDLSNQRLSALLRQLLLTGEVLRVEINQVYYFEIAD